MRELLGKLPKPSHYAGIEDGAILKNPSSVKLHIALAFPDVYEVGMSYLGQKILYGIVNKNPDWWAERVMSPDREACAILRASSAPLCTLESDTPLADLAAVGFSVTHELCFTDILNMLDLANIPLRSADRPENLKDCPIVIAGGGAMLGCEPLSPFIDLVALGDGEELLPEILGCLEKARAMGWTRRQFLEKARFIPGAYIPSFFKEDENGVLAPIFSDYRPKRRIVSNLDTAFYPERQVAPVGAVHNRLSLEIGRGCSRGCRFCHAGAVYRPVRERKPDTIDDLLNSCLSKTGFDEVSFLSLSAGDCTALKEIYDRAHKRCQKAQTSLCLPSLRVGSVDDEIMAKMAELKRPGATLAPEAGSQRLRDVINKGITEEELILHLQKLIEYGWRQVKLYFMIGLPTETDDDLAAIVDLCLKARDAGGKGAPRLQVTASVSPFVPKPFTPFQWEAQIDLPEIERRVSLLRDLFKAQKGLKLKWHEPASSHLEGIFSRGDRRLADVIEKAFHKGAIFSGWNEFFEFAPWQEALAECGINAQDYIRSRSGSDNLPWGHIDAGITTDFLWRERQKAYQGQPTADCRFGKCADCGACDEKTGPACAAKPSHILVNKQRDQTGNQPCLDETGRLVLRDFEGKKPKLPAQLVNKAAQFRIWHEKTGGPAYLSQLELQSVIQRALRRAGIPIAFSQGFHPLPLISFGRALPVGVESDLEWFELTLHSYLAPVRLERELNACLPAGLKISKIEACDKKSGQAISETFALEFQNEADLLKAANSFSCFAEAEAWEHSRETKKGIRTEDIRPLLLNWKISVNGAKTLLIFTTDWMEAYLSPLTLVRAILGEKEELNFKLRKLGQTFANGDYYAKELKNG